GLRVHPRRGNAGSCRRSLDAGQRCALVRDGVPRILRDRSQGRVQECGRRAGVLPAAAVNGGRMRTIAVLCACLLAQRALADLAAVGPEFQVNTYTTGQQLQPRVGADASGNFVVVWGSGSYYEAGPDGSRTAVSARRFDAAGSPQ